MYSPGKVLVGELRSLIRESTLLGYRLDISTLEEINFYLDPIEPIPVMKGFESLSNQLVKGEGKLVLMPEEAYDEVRSQGNVSITFVQKFLYKKERLFLVSNRSGK